MAYLDGPCLPARHVTGIVWDSFSTTGAVVGTGISLPGGRLAFLARHNPQLVKYAVIPLKQGGGTRTETISKDGDEVKVARRTCGGGKGGAEVVLVVVEDEGHTWPGQEPPLGFIGKSARNVSANELIWELFQRHQLK